MRERERERDTHTHTHTHILTIYIKYANLWYQIFTLYYKLLEFISVKILLLLKHKKGQAFTKSCSSLSLSQMMVARVRMNLRRKQKSPVLWCQRLRGPVWRLLSPVFVRVWWRPVTPTQNWDIQSDKHGADRWTLSCPVLDLLLALETSGDFLTSVIRMEEVRYIQSGTDISYLTKQIHRGSKCLEPKLKMWDFLFYPQLLTN